MSGRERGTLMTRLANLMEVSHCLFVQPAKRIILRGKEGTQHGRHGIILVWTKTSSRLLLPYCVLHIALVVKLIWLIRSMPRSWQYWRRWMLGSP